MAAPDWTKVQCVEASLHRTGFAPAAPDALASWPARLVQRLRVRRGPSGTPRFLILIRGPPVADVASPVAFGVRCPAAVPGWENSVRCRICDGRHIPRHTKADIRSARRESLGRCGRGAPKARYATQYWY